MAGDLHAAFAAYFFAATFLLGFAFLYLRFRCCGEDDGTSKLSFAELQSLYAKRRERKLQKPGRKAAKKWGFTIHGKEPSPGVSLKKKLFSSKFKSWRAEGGEFAPPPPSAPSREEDVRLLIDDDRGREIYGDAWFEATDECALPLREIFAVPESEMTALKDQLQQQT